MTNSLHCTWSGYVCHDDPPERRAMIMHQIITAIEQALKESDTEPRTVYIRVSTQTKTEITR